MQHETYSSYRSPIFALGRRKNVVDGFRSFYDERS